MHTRFSDRDQQLYLAYLAVRCTPCFLYFPQIDPSFGPRLTLAEAFTVSWLNKFRKYGELTFPSDHGGVVLVGNNEPACMPLDQPISCPPYRELDNQWVVRNGGNPTFALVTLAYYLQIFFHGYPTTHRR